jgi:hypothetical protein
MWLCVGSASIGLLVGTLVGMSSDHLAKVALGLIFGLLGSSVIAFLQKVRLEDRALAGGMLLAISCGSLAGLYSGIFVSEYQLLTPTAHRSWDSLGVNTESNRDSPSLMLGGLIRLPWPLSSTGSLIITTRGTK